MSKTAFLVMDIQNGVLKLIKAPDDFVHRMTATITAARQASIPVIYVKSAFRPGFPDASPRNLGISRVKAMGEHVFVEGSDFTAIHNSIAAVDGDVIITKRRNSAFTGTDLEIVLRSLGVEHLVMAGVKTSGVVLSTVRQAADMDYRITVLQDLCLDDDADAQRVLMERIFPRQGAVVTAKTWLEEPL